MKRSRSVRLALLGSASALSLVACDEPKDPLAEGSFHRDPVECAQKLDRATCDAAYSEARTEHLKSAPAFASREACEQNFGTANCSWQEANVGPEQIQEQRQGGASAGSGWFMPLMAGYLIGNVLGNRNVLPGQGLLPGQAALPGQGANCGQPGLPACTTGTSGSSSSPRSSSGASSFSSRPIYRNADDQVFSGRTALGTSKIAAASSSSRGGFGSTARSHSSSSSSS